MTTLSIDDMTPPAVVALAEKMGGMVMGVILAVEIATPDGERHSLALWDHESSVALQLGLDRLLSIVMDVRAQASCEMAYEDDDEEDEDG